MYATFFIGLKNSNGLILLRDPFLFSYDVIGRTMEGSGLKNCGNQFVWTLLNTCWMDMHSLGVLEPILLQQWLFSV